MSLPETKIKWLVKLPRLPFGPINKKFLNLNKQPWKEAVLGNLERQKPQSEADNQPKEFLKKYKARKKYQLTPNPKKHQLLFPPNLQQMKSVRPQYKDNQKKKTPTYNWQPSIKNSNKPLKKYLLKTKRATNTKYKNWLKIARMRRWAIKKMNKPAELIS